MFGVKEDNSSTAKSELNTIVGKGSVIDGNIHIKNSIRVDGKVKGEVSSSGTVTVGAEGEIEGTVNAANAIIGGRVRGKLNVKGKIVLEKNSVLIGDLATNKLTISEGAIFDGNCIMDNQDGLGKNVKAKSDEKAGK